MLISIIIVNYNTKVITLNCLRSIYKQLNEGLFEIIVVDNASSDDSVESMRCEFPNITLIEAGENLGFGKANNLGIKSAKGEYFWFLNSDTILKNDALLYFMDFILKYSHLNIGAIGSILRKEDGEIGSSYGSFVHPFKELILSIFNTIRTPRYITIDQNSENNTDYFEVGWISGASFIMKKSIFDKLNGFDPNFFMYSEEVDLQKRSCKLGYHNFIIKGPEIIHLEGGSSKSYSKNVNLNKINMIYHSQQYYVKNNYNALTYRIYKLAFCLINGMKTILNPKYNAYERKVILKEMLKR